MRIAILLALAAIVAYSSNLVLTVEANATPNVLTAASWIAQGNADLDEYVGRAPFTEQIVDGHVYPANPPGTALLLVTPVAVAMAAGIDVASWEFLGVFGKIAGILAASVSVAFVYLACARLTRPMPALIAAVGYAFGTTVWTVSAQQIWMHGPARSSWPSGSSCSSAAAGALAPGSHSVWPRPFARSMPLPPRPASSSREGGASLRATLPGAFRRLRSSRRPTSSLFAAPAIASAGSPGSFPRH